MLEAIINIQIVFIYFFIYFMLLVEQIEWIKEYKKEMLELIDQDRTEEDWKAIANDFSVVGQDLRNALKKEIELLNKKDKKNE